MNKYGLHHKTFNLIISTLKKYSEIDTALIIGSRAIGNYKNSSDIDLVLKGNLTFDKIAKIKYELEEVLPIPYYFDIIHYETIQNINLKQHIDQYGQQIYIKS